MGKYQEIFKRSIEDPEGFWGEAAEADHLGEEVGQGSGRLQPALLPLVRGRRAQHLLQRAGPACRGRPRRADGAHLRQPGDRTSPRSSPTASSATQVARFAGALAGPGREEGRHGHHLHADGPRGRDRHARLRPHRRRPLGGLRRLRAQRAGHPHRRRQAQGHRHRLLRHRGQEGHRVQAAAGRGHRAGRRTSRTNASSSSGPRSRPNSSPAATSTGRRSPPRRQPGRLRAGRGHRPPLHPLHLRHHRHPQGRRAGQRRPRRGAHVDHEEHLRRRTPATSTGPPPTWAGWWATPTSSTRRS